MAGDDDWDYSDGAATCEECGEPPCDCTCGETEDHGDGCYCEECQGEREEYF